MMTETITVDVVSDVVCPWCYIGQKRLEAAIASVPEADVEVRWRPFQLDATIPASGNDRKQYMLAKFGSEDRVRDMHQRILPIGEAEGIAFDFDAIKVSPNTLDAHRVIRWAGTDNNDVQNALVRNLFELYFEKGVDIGERSALIGAAKDAGMDPAVVETLLAGDADREAVYAEVATASRMGITGVPCFLLESKYAVMGAQDSATMADAIRQVAAEKAKGELGGRN